MPIYEYVCDNCGHYLEALQKLSDEPLVFCPECGDAALRKQVSAAAFRLKGTGWYETDFKNSDKKKPAEKAKKESKSSSGSSSDSGSSSESSGSSGKQDKSSSASSSSGKSSSGKSGSSASKSA
ncbi:MAG: FmdB family transcriptional regulator [Acidiferrobacter sp.]|nr:FmdB family transcriptional regulator [Acidiferrobacter sp.]